MSRVDPSGLYTLYEVRKTYCEKQYKNANPAHKAEGIQACMWKIAGTQKNFDLWYEAEKADMGWMKDLPKCPCKLTCPANPNIHNPNTKVWDEPHAPYDAEKYHPGGVWEIRTIKANAHGAGQQCIYDKAGNLITAGYGAGTADRKQASGAVGTIFHWTGDTGHIGHDVSPFDLAYELDGDKHGANVDKYIEVRPANNGYNCLKNP